MFDEYDTGYDTGLEEPMVEEPAIEEPAMPVMIPVESSNVQEFGYHEESQTLYVRFMEKGNSPSSLYAYYGVSYDVYEAFFNAPSKGKFIWTDLRDRYEYARVE